MERILSTAGFASRTGPSSWSFDWTQAGHVGPLDQRLVRSAVMGGDADLEALIAAVDAYLAATA